MNESTVVMAVIFVLCMVLGWAILRLAGYDKARRLKKHQPQDYMEPSAWGMNKAVLASMDYGTLIKVNLKNVHWQTAKHIKNMIADIESIEAEHGKWKNIDGDICRLMPGRIWESRPRELPTCHICGKTSCPGQCLNDRF